MEPLIDDGLSEDQFLIATPVDEHTYVEFENSIRGKRVSVMKRVEPDPLPDDMPVHGEWDMIRVTNGKVAGRTRVKWIDQGKLDWYNGHLWETVSEQELDDSLCGVLLAYAKMVRHHEQDLNRFAPQMKQLEMVLGTVLRKCATVKARG